MAELAKANGVHLVFGYPEKVVDNDQATTTTYYNSAIFISAEGEVLLNYRYRCSRLLLLRAAVGVLMKLMVVDDRKTHLWGPYEKKYFTPGSSLAPVVKIGGSSSSVCWVPAANSLTLMWW
jgi:predicted amidohydrolase